MSKQLHSLQRERKEWEKKKRMEKTQPTKRKETFTNGPLLKKKKYLRGCRKGVTQSAKLMNFFFQNIFKLFPTCSPLPLIRQGFGTQLSTNPSSKPPQAHLNYTDKEW